MTGAQNHALDTFFAPVLGLRPLVAMIPTIYTQKLDRGEIPLFNRHLLGLGSTLRFMS